MIQKLHRHEGLLEVDCSTGVTLLFRYDPTQELDEAHGERIDGLAQAEHRYPPTRYTLGVHHIPDSALWEYRRAAWIARYSGRRW